MAQLRTNIDDQPLALRGRYRGEPLDVCSRRSIQIRDFDRAFNSDRRQIVVDYFYHEGQFWTAEIPLDGVANLLGQAFNFSKPKMRNGAEGPEKIYDADGVPLRKIACLNHLQTRFQFNSNAAIRLYPLGTEPNGRCDDEVDDFVYSIEAVGPTGVGFGIRDGVNGSLVSAHRFVSTREVVFERCVVEGQYVLESAPLPVSDSQKQQLLRAALERSHRAGMEETYYLYRCCGTNNCTSSPFQMVDSVAKYNWWQRLGAMLYRLPLSPRRYLRVRGLDADPNHRRLLREEFTEYVEDKATQQRKRDYVRSKTKALRAARAARALE